MEKTELMRARDQATPTINPAGYQPKTEYSNQLNNPIHQLQENFGINWIVIDGNIAYNETNSYFQQIRTPEGILLKLVDPFTEEKSNPQPAISQQLEDDF